MVTSYLTWLSEGDETDPSPGAYLVYGLQLLRCTVPKSDFLVNSKEALAGWKKQALGRMRMPVPEEFVYDLATHALETGHLDVCVAILPAALRMPWAPPKDTVTSAGPSS